MSEERRGTVLGVAAYLIWGLFPLYWPLLEPAGAVEILAHRVVWSLASVTLLLLVVSGRAAWRALPRDARSLGFLAVAGVLIGINWGVYIWGVNHGHVVETSLGYFVNPLVTVALSVVVLRERSGRRGGRARARRGRLPRRAGVPRRGNVLYRWRRPRRAVGEFGSGDGHPVVVVRGCRTSGLGRETGQCQ